MPIALNMPLINRMSPSPAGPMPGGMPIDDQKLRALVMAGMGPQRSRAIITSRAGEEDNYPYIMAPTLSGPPLSGYPDASMKERPLISAGNDRRREELLWNIMEKIFDKEGRGNEVKPEGVKFAAKEILDIYLKPKEKITPRDLEKIDDYKYKYGITRDILEEVPEQEENAPIAKEEPVEENPTEFTKKLAETYSSSLRRKLVDQYGTWDDVPEALKAGVAKRALQKAGFESMNISKLNAIDKNISPKTDFSGYDKLTFKNEIDAAEYVKIMKEIDKQVDSNILYADKIKARMDVTGIQERLKKIGIDVPAQVIIASIKAASKDQANQVAEGMWGRKPPSKASDVLILKIGKNAVDLDYPQLNKWGIKSKKFGEPAPNAEELSTREKESKEMTPENEQIINDENERRWLAARKQKQYFIDRANQLAEEMSHPKIGRPKGRVRRPTRPSRGIEYE